MDLPSGLPIDHSDWEQTPRAVQGVVITLWQMIGLLRQEIAAQQDQIIRQRNQIAQQQEQIAHLQSGVAKLREQVNQDSGNSSSHPRRMDHRRRPDLKVDPLGGMPGDKRGIMGMVAK